jgi:hypothetical protein
MTNNVNISRSGKPNDCYGDRVELIRRAFNEISALCLKYDYDLTDEDWRVLDEARLDEATSYDELREKLKTVYLRVKRNTMRQTSKSGGTDVLVNQT